MNQANIVNPALLQQGTDDLRDGFGKGSITVEAERPSQDPAYVVIDREARFTVDVQSDAACSVRTDMGELLKIVSGPRITLSECRHDLRQAPRPLDKPRPFSGCDHLIRVRGSERSSGGEPFDEGR